jgi:hypothetical protein
MGLTLRDQSAKGRLRSLEGECWIDREISGCEFRDARLGIPQTAHADWKRHGTKHSARLPGLGEYQGSLSFLL